MPLSQRRGGEAERGPRHRVGRRPQRRPRAAVRKRTAQGRPRGRPCGRPPGLAIQYASHRLRKDRWTTPEQRESKDVVLAYVKRSLAREASQWRREDRDVVLAAVRQNGLALRHADETLRNDREVVLAAFSNDGLASRQRVRVISCMSYGSNSI